MIKIFLNMEEKIVEVYTETGAQEIEFDDINVLKNVLGDREIYYITGLKKTKADEIIKFVYNIQGKILKTAKTYNNIEEIGNEKVYLHNMTKGIVFIPDIKLSLKGGYDFLQITDEMKGILQNSKSINKLISSGKLKIIGETERKILMKKSKKEEKEKQDQREAGLDSIIVQRNADGDFVSAKNGIATTDGKLHDVISVDVMDKGEGEEGSETMEENLKNLEDLP